MGEGDWEKAPLNFSTAAEDLLSHRPYILLLYLLSEIFSNKKIFRKAWAVG